MKLIRIKIRGLGTTPETRWLDVSPGITLFHVPVEEAGRAFTKAIQTLNPPYECQAEQPYSDLPTTSRRDGHTRIIQPHKRTVAIGVFGGTPRLVEKLAVCSPLFYETDRIEIGRRLDYSRWINFVELSASTRWSEISEDIFQLYAAYGNPSPDSEDPGPLIDQLRPTDRIKNETMEKLSGWLRGLTSAVPTHSRDQIRDLANDVERAHHFSAAREILKDQLPLFFIIDPHQPLITRLDIDCVQPPPSSLPPTGFLLYQLQRKLSKRAGPSQFEPGSTTCSLINEELSRLGSGLTLRFEQGDKTIWLESEDTRDTALNQNHSCPANGLPDDVTFIIAAAKALCGSPPILLFHHVPESFGFASSKKIAACVKRLAKQCQCLVTTTDSNLLRMHDDAMCHQWRDFEIKRDVP